MAKEMKCTYNPWKLAGGAILVGVGAFFGLAGLLTQIKDTWSWLAIVWYVIGALLLFFGKKLKHKAHANCPMHGMHGMCC